MAKVKLEIDDDRFPSNSKSNRSAPIRNDSDGVEVEVVTPKKARRTIQGKAILKKRSLAESIAQLFVGEDARGVGSYILQDVLLPAAKSTIQEMITSGIEMIFYGEGGSRGKSRNRGESKVSYSSYYRRDREKDNPYDPRSRATRGRDRFNLNEIFFRNHEEAEEVLYQLCERLEDYDEVTVADYFELAGIDGATWAHNKYGWTSLKKAFNTHTRNGWAIVLPDPVELE